MSACMMLMRNVMREWSFLWSRESRYRNNRRIKASDQLKWVGLMNNTWSAAEEIVVKEIVYI